MSTTEYPRPPLERGLVSQTGSIKKIPGGGDGGDKGDGNGNGGVMGMVVRMCQRG